MTNWTDIYTKWKTSMQLLAYHYMHDQQLAEDIVQDVFLRLLEKNMSALFINHAAKYLSTAVYHQCMTYHRRKAKQHSIDEWFDSTGMSANNTEDQIQYRELKQCYLNALKSLPQKQREVFVLRHIEGYKGYEIANILGKSNLTIKKQYRQSKQTMRTALKSLRA